MDNQTSSRFSVHLTTFAVFLAFIVIVLGAYTRLTDAGLGCPDWPGCYGHLVVPKSQKSIERAELLFPKTPVVAYKAWNEMVHRYAAGILGICIFILAYLALRNRKNSQQSLFIPLLLIGIVIFQVLLGKWTVTMALIPIVVMGHLLGGLTILSLLWWMHLSQTNRKSFQSIDYARSRFFRPWAVIGLIIVVLQIALGGWTSANYASLSCLNFPYCVDHSSPIGEFHKAFNFFMPLGANFEGGVLDSIARMTIHMMHRIGGLVTAVYLSVLAICIMLSARQVEFRRIALFMLVVLFTQVCLGILNVILLLPLGIAVAHNAFASVLLLTLVTLNYVLYAKPSA